MIGESSSRICQLWDSSSRYLSWPCSLPLLDSSFLCIKVSFSLCKAFISNAIPCIFSSISINLLFNLVSQLSIIVNSYSRTVCECMVAGIWILLQQQIDFFLFIAIDGAKLHCHRWYQAVGAISNYAFHVLNNLQSE